MNGGGEDLRSQGAANTEFANNNMASKPKAVLSHADQNFNLVFFGSITRNQHRRKKTSRQQLAAIILLKKKNFSMTSPNAIVTPQKGASRDIAVL
jgi:hypothetical protein